MKRLTEFVVMVFILALGVFIVISDKILDREVNRYAIDVFQSLLFFEAALMGINEFGKKLENKEQKTEEIDGFLKYADNRLQLTKNYYNSYNLAKIQLQLEGILEEYKKNNVW